MTTAIFPFENVSGNNDLDYLNLSFADSLNYSLSPISRIEITPTSTIKKYVGQNYDPQTEGKKLAVDNIVTGSYRTENDKIIVDVQITDISKERPIIQQKQFDSSISDLTPIRTAIFRFLITGLKLDRTDEELVEIQKQETQNPQAYENYLRGTNAYLNLQYDSAVRYFQSSLESDPNFVAALEGLATTYFNKGSSGCCGTDCYQKGLEYYEKIIKLASHYEPAKLHLALAYLDLNRTDEAISLIKEVIAQNPNNKFAYFCLASAYRYAGLLDESAKVIEQSQFADNKYSALPQLKIVYLYQKQYDKFLSENHPPADNAYGVFYGGLANYDLKNFTEAKKLFDQSYKAGADILVGKISKVYADHLDKNDSEALKILAQIRANLLENQVGDGEIIYKVAQAYAELKQSKEALELFNLSIDKGFFCYPYFAADPMLDNLRNDPEFHTALQKAKKRHEEFKSKYAENL